MLAVFLCYSPLYVLRQGLLQNPELAYLTRLPFKILWVSYLYLPAPWLEVYTLMLSIFSVCQRTELRAISSALRLLSVEVKAMQSKCTDLNYMLLMYFEKCGFMQTLLLKHPHHLFWQSPPASLPSHFSHQTLVLLVFKPCVTNVTIFRLF